MAAPCRLQPARSRRRSRSTPTTSAASSRSERAGSRRLGHRRDDRTADQVRQDGRHRRSGPLRHPRPADRELRGLGARLRARRFAEGARQARPAAQPHRGAGAERARGGALLSGDLLVRDDEDSAGEGFRRHDRHPARHHARDLAQADEQRRLHRLPSARAGSRRAPSRRSSATSRSGEEAWIAPHRRPASPASS